MYVFSYFQDLTIKENDSRVKVLKASIAPEPSNKVISDFQEQPTHEFHFGPLISEQIWAMYNIQCFGH